MTTKKLYHCEVPLLVIILLSDNVGQPMVQLTQGATSHPKKKNVLEKFVYRHGIM